MGLEERLLRLERTLSASHRSGTPAYLERYFREVENIRRKEAGEEPLPYTAFYRRGDEECLRETIPAYRKEAGWQTDGAREFLDLWEQGVRDRLERGAA